MAKVKTTWICQECGASAPKWIGKCPACGSWNSYVEEVISKPVSNSTGSGFQEKAAPVLLDDLDVTAEDRIDTGNGELNRVLGGGLVRGSVVLIGGDPGIGKSTLLLQVLMSMNKVTTLYVSGEESGPQIRMRAERLGLSGAKCYVLTETSVPAILDTAKTLNPAMVVIDSIQTMQSDRLEATPGSVSQIRQCAAEFQHFAKSTHIPVVLIGHITKEGALAGPKVLEHMVDTVLQFEGEQNYGYRILRTTKNRFGSTSELGIYEMTGTGLREVTNPSQVLTTHRDEDISGVANSVIIEGNRPLLVETQALVSNSTFGTPIRSATGLDNRRLNMLLAIIDKRLGFRMGNRDVFCNITGGLRVADPAIDLALIVAILSSNEDLPVPANYCFTGETGLSGEIRPVPKTAARIAEAEKIGMTKIFIPEPSAHNFDQKRFKIEIVPVARVDLLISAIFG
ncbi:MAG: DNA repair protein RadA [Bacteroidales bacterium]